MPELRIDPICGRRVYIAEDRAGRPADYILQEPHAADGSPEAVGARLAQCPFCAGHESATPDAVATVLDAAGRWRVRVVPNKYPAVSFAKARPAACGLAPELGLDTGAKPQAAFGVHEVIIESPEHVTELEVLDLDQIAVVLGVYRDRLQHWAADGSLRHGIVFKNSGFAAGASLEHIHSQFVAVPYVPAAVQAELDGAERFFQARQQCVFCDLVEREAAAGDRLVFRQGGYAVVCAYAGRQPYETWILPERHAARFEATTDAELRQLAQVLRDLLRRLAALSGRLAYQLAYNLILHTGPFDGSTADSYHWHWEVIPRITHLAGLEWGAGVHINPVSPERAAQALRSVRPAR